MEILIIWAFSKVSTEHCQTHVPPRALVSGFSLFPYSGLSVVGSSSYSGSVSFVDLSLFVLRLYLLPVYLSAPMHKHTPLTSAIGEPVCRSAETGRLAGT